MTNVPVIVTLTVSQWSILVHIYRQPSEGLYLLSSPLSCTHPDCECTALNSIRPTFRRVVCCISLSPLPHILKAFDCPELCCATLYCSSLNFAVLHYAVTSITEHELRLIVSFTCLPSIFFLLLRSRRHCTPHLCTTVAVDVAV